MTSAKMKDADMPLRDRIEAAIERVTAGHGQMRVPVEATDPDVVLADCLAELDAARAREASWQARAWEQERSAAEESFRADDAEKQVATLRAREATLREALEQLVHAVDAHQVQAWATSDIDTSVARAALAEGENR